MSEITSKYKMSGQERVGMCFLCWGKGYTRETCWNIIWYSKWYNKHKKSGNQRVNFTANKWSYSNKNNC